MSHIHIRVRSHNGEITVSPTPCTGGKVIGGIVQIGKGLFEARVTDKSVHGINLVRGTSVKDCADNIVLKSQQGAVYVIPEVGFD